MVFFVMRGGPYDNANVKTKRKVYLMWETISAVLYISGFWLAIAHYQLWAIHNNKAAPNVGTKLLVGILWPVAGFFMLGKVLFNGCR